MNPTPSWILSVCLCITAVLLVSTEAQARVYRVKKGDWLGKIGRKFLPGDPYGKNGSVKRIVRLNPDIHNPDTIEPGELVYVPDGPEQEKSKKAAATAAKQSRHKTGGAAVATGAARKKPHKTTAASARCAPSGDRALNPNGPLVVASAPTQCQLCPTPTALQCPAPASSAEPSASGGSATTCAPSAPCHCPMLACKDGVTIMQSMPDVQAPLSARLHRHLRLRLAPYFRFSELAAQDDDTGAAVNLASRYNTGLTAGLSINALEYLEISLDLRGGALDYASPSKNAALLTSVLFSYAVSAGGELTLLRRLGIYIGLSFGNEPFSKADSTQIQEVTMINLPAVVGALRLTALRFDHWVLGAEAQGAFKLGAAERGYIVHPGTALYAGLFWQWFNPDDTAWTVSAGYSQRQQNTTLITQTDKSINLEASYRWSL